MSGTASTVTLNVHRSVRCIASVATHEAVELPMGKLEPDGGVHATVTGATPPVAIGGGNVTVALRLVVRTV